jgi:type 1 glutamine amidotransferase
MRLKLFLISFFLLAPLSAQAPAPTHPPLSQEDKDRIDRALPTRAPAKPRKARRMLVSTLGKNNGRIVRGHPSIPHANYAIDQMGKRTGAYEAVFSNDIEMFRPGTIEQFDALCFNNTVGVLFDDEELKESLLGFIAKGRGWVGFHAAAATFVQYPRYDQWPPFGQMVGGTENGGHPWGPTETITIKVEDPKHPLNGAFAGKGFEIADEVYQLQETDLRGRLRVLLSIDVEKSDVGPNRRILPIRRKDLDFPMTWIKPHEKGRVFYSSFGHNPDIFWHKELLEHFLAGIQYALGDLAADDTPSGLVGARKNSR